jgi:cell division septation protein DedD
MRAAVSFGLIMAVSVALSGAVLADHDPADGPEVIPTLVAFAGGDPATGCIRINAPTASDTGIYSADGHVTYYYNSSTKLLTFVMDSGYLMAKVYAKGGTNQNVYDYTGFYGGGIAHDDGLSAPINPDNNQPYGLSHVDFCPVQEQATATPTAEPTATPTPSPTPTAEPTATPTPTPTPTLPTTGETPTPTPTLPDTSGNPTTSATPPDPTGNAFLLLLIGSVAGLMFMFLPRKKRERLS